MSVDVPPTVPLPVLPEDASSRLMRMLESVRLEKMEVEAKETAAAQRSACPQCQSSVPWENSSWCPDCGYYPKLGRAMTPGEIEMTQHPQPAVSLQWLFWLGLGGTVLIALSTALCVLIPDHVDRGSFGRTQFVTGIVMLLAAQVRAYIVATHGRDSLPLSSLFFEPFQLWLPVLRQLPQTRHILYSGAWGGMAMGLALCVTGMNFDGMFSGMRLHKPKRTMMQAIVQAVSATEGNSAFSSSSDEELDEDIENLSGTAAGSSNGLSASGDLESAMKDFSGAADAAELADAGSGESAATAADIAANFSAPSANDENNDANKTLYLARKTPLSPSGQKRTDQGAFLIFGYMTNSAGEIRSLLLAHVRSQRARFVGKLPLDEITDKERQLIQQQLDRFRSSRPALHIAYHARWVKPLLIAHVAHAGWTPEGQLREGYLIRLDSSQLALSAASSTAPTSQP